MKVTIHKHFSFSKRHGFFLPLEGINACLWGHFIVQMVGYPANLSFYFSLRRLLAQALVQLQSLERGVQRDREQRGEMDAIGQEGPRARLLRNYSSLEMRCEPESHTLAVRHHCYATVLHRRASLRWDGRTKRTITGPPNKAKSRSRVWRWEKTAVYRAIFSRSCWKATEKLLRP